MLEPSQPGSLRSKQVADLFEFRVDSEFVAPLKNDLGLQFQSLPQKFGISVAGRP